MREQGVGLGRPSTSPRSSSFADKSNTSVEDPAINLSGGKQRSSSATFTTSSGRTVRPPAQFRSFTSAVSSTPSPTAAPLGRTRSHPTIPVSSHGGDSSTRSPFDFDFDDRSSDAESSGAGSGPRKRPKKMPGSLSILDGCTIFVDVRTEEGDDASALFVDMLQGLGAKILTRGVGQTCTHVVYKNGLASTIAKVKLMDADGRPHVVGIGWVVECAEKREQADESKFAVDIEGLHVAGASKRRKSVMPQPMAITSGPMDAFMEFQRMKNGDSSGSAKDNSIVMLDDSSGKASVFIALATQI
ncbi:hypothetical protein SCHPADRAFT_827682 [Schizopora paradoxa]|uniref:BRCT domain-containing protein n=1 Tax=Schizopora paradoxa TaxID=27342 RepID=A0A0H2RPU3_9AGAM|nr:hypothetical protein SCHPADRAFT_827682 [Schizopora paradoxa]